jgi:hypothetical protein
VVRRQKVQVGRVTHRLSTEEGGIAYVSFEVYEAGEQLFPSGTEDTSATTLSAADKVKEALASGDYFAALDGVGSMVDTLLEDMEALSPACRLCRMRSASGWTASTGLRTSPVAWPPPR